MKMTATVKAFVERQMRAQRRSSNRGIKQSSNPWTSSDIPIPNTPVLYSHSSILLMPTLCKYSIQSPIVQDSSIVYWVLNLSWSFIQWQIVLGPFYSVMNFFRNVRPFSVNWDLFHTTVKVVPFFNRFVKQKDKDIVSNTVLMRFTCRALHTDVPIYSVPFA